MVASTGSARAHSLRSLDRHARARVYRQVTREEGAALAASWPTTAFTESSARHNENVSRIFEAVVAQIEKDMNPEPEKQEKSGCVIA